MKSLLATLVIAAGALGGVLVYKTDHLPCKQVLHYAIGNFDPRFGIAQNDFKAELARGEKLWEDAEGKELFQYDPDAAFKVNLIYDERQERAQAGQKLDQSRAALETTQANLQATEDKLLKSYNQKVAQYNQDLSDYQKHVKDYNAEVESWNRQGGAPPEEYKKLQSEGRDLEKEQEHLDQERASINALAAQINKTSKQHVSLVDKYNQQVENYVGQYGNGGEAFEEGDYDGSNINVYEFTDLGDLRVVIAHEMGHALGLEHVDNPKSIMYYLMGAQDQEHVALSAEDKQALQTQCSMGPMDLAKQDFSRLRERLSTLVQPK